MIIASTQTAIQQALSDAGIVLNAIQCNIVRNEALKRYKLHTDACQKTGIQPDDFSKFVVEISEQMVAGIYEPQHRLTEVNNDGCQKLLQAIVIRAQQMVRLNEWHQRYITACKDAGVRAYALQLILDAVNAAATPLHLSNESLSTQTERINALVAEYVKVTGRKENPRWFARAPQRVKPSKKFNKYAY